MQRVFSLADAARGGSWWLRYWIRGW